ncbi:MAG: entericidin EcnAB [Alphaproteobacteria bacterium CG11_big_fil_rev_8_21_14_0_20_44_7]|nr:MAG: entericidin EcnAB [Alphaproteobacteria bacterium CG11_big_fil_rev_8_21_14_0_20_44_7]
MKKIYILFAILAFTSLSACNTVKGVGRDVEKLGENIQDTSK